ncbi:MAG: ligand-binding sensor domain-containing protein, partial [Mucilaginibacter sp.]
MSCPIRRELSVCFKNLYYLSVLTLKSCSFDFGLFNSTPMHTKFYFLLVVALFFTCINAFGQSSQYRFSQLDISNGLSHNQVTCIFKDSEGFMWFGTASGLNRYDGYSFKIFKHDADNKNSVLNDFIKNIYEGP